jgi:Flp pilus assembly protein TadD
MTDFGWWSRARDAYFADELGEALACVERYRERAADASVGIYLHHKILAKLQRLDDAGALAEIMMQWAPKAEIAYALAAFFDARHDVASAEHWFATGSAVEPTSTVGFILLGGFYARRGRLVEAEATHRHAATLAGHPDEAFLNLAMVLRATGRFDAALAAARRCAAVDPASAATVIADLERAIALRDAPSDREDWWRLAVDGWAARDRIGEALIAIERYRREVPSSEPGRLLAAEILTDLRRFDEAWALLAGLPRRMRGVPGAIMRHLQLRGDLICLEEWHTWRCHAAPADASAVLDLGGTYAAQGRLADAEAAYRRAAMLDGEGGRDRAVVQLGLALRAQGRFEDARDAFARAPATLAAGYLADVVRAIERTTGAPP